MSGGLPPVTTITVKPPEVSFFDKSTGIFFYKSPISVTRCHTSQVPRTQHFSRAGVIPLYYDDIKWYYCLGVDRKSQNLTDFGGCVEQGETAIDAALRELKEESLGLFDFIDASKIIEESSFAIYNDTSVVFFVLVDVDPNDIVRRFRRHLYDESENSDLVWVDEDEFRLLFRGKHEKFTLYKRVRDVVGYVDGLFLT